MSEYISRKYPALSKVATTAFSIFHGPRVESSFSSMGNILEKKRSQLNVETYDAYQTVRYYLTANKQTACGVFDMDAVDKDIVMHRRLYHNLRLSASRYKKAKIDNAKRRPRKALTSAKKNEEQIKKQSSDVMRRHFLKTKRERALAILSAKTVAARKK